MVALLSIAALVTSCCSTWKSQSKPPRELLAAQEPGRTPPDKVLVHGIAGTEVIVSDPWIRGDSLVGYMERQVGATESASWNGPRSTRMMVQRGVGSIPLDSIRTVDVRGTSALKTLALWAVILGSMTALVASSSSGSLMY